MSNWRRYRRRCENLLRTHAGAAHDSLSSSRWPLFGHRHRLFAARGSTLRNASPTFQIAAQTSMVAMRDGVENSRTDVYLPKSAPRARPLEKPSTILIPHPPTTKGPGTSPEGKYFASKRLTPSSCRTPRGRYASEGTWHWLTDDGPRRRRLLCLDRRSTLVQRPHSA